MPNIFKVHRKYVPRRKECGVRQLRYFRCFAQNETVWKRLLHHANSHWDKSLTHHGARGNVMGHLVTPSPPRSSTQSQQTPTPLHPDPYHTLLNRRPNVLLSSFFCKVEEIKVQRVIVNVVRLLSDEQTNFWYVDMIFCMSSALKDWPLAFRVMEMLLHDLTSLCTLLGLVHSTELYILHIFSTECCFWSAGLSICAAIPHCGCEWEV